MNIANVVSCHANSPNAEWFLARATNALPVVHLPDAFHLDCPSVDGIHIDFQSLEHLPEVLVAPVYVSRMPLSLRLCQVSHQVPLSLNK